MADRMGLLLIVENLSDYRNATVTVQKLNDDVAKSMKAVEGAGEKGAAGTKQLTMAMIKGHFAVKAATKALKAFVSFGKALIVDSTMLAARVEVLGVVLNRVGANAGYSKEQIVKLEESVKACGITTKAARQSLIMMAQANVDWAYATDLARVAQNAATIAGIDSSQAFERLIYAMSRGRTYIMRTLGIMTDFVKAEQEMADSLGKTRKELDESELMRARYNETMRAAAAIEGVYEEAMGAAGKQLTSLVRLQEEAQLALGKTFLPTFSDLIVAATDFLKGLNEALEENAEELVVLGTAIGDLVGEFIDFKKALSPEDLREFIESFTTLVRMLQVGIKTVKEWREELEGIAEVIHVISYLNPGLAIGRGIKAGIGKLIPSLTEARKGYEELLAKQKEYASWMEAEKGELALAREKATAGLRSEVHVHEEASKQIIELTDDQKKAAEALAGLRLDLQRELADRLVAEERKIIQRSIEIQREREDIAREYAKKVTEAYAEAAKARAELPVESAEQMQEFERRAQRQAVEMERDAAADREKVDVDYARKRVDIERDLRRRLVQIQSEFEQSVQDASRTRDAFALVQAQRTAKREREGAHRSRDEQLEDAKTARDREMQDLEQSLARQRERLQQSLAQERIDLQESLVKRQQDIEAQLQEALVAAETERQADLQAQTLKLAREKEMEALHAQWEEEDRQKRLARQLEDMEKQYGELYGVTAEGLAEQMNEWAEAYGPEGAASKLATEFGDLVVDEMDRMQKAMVEMANEWVKAMKLLEQTGFGISLPPELQFQSPKLGLQRGLEELQGFLKAKPLSIFADGRAPSAAAGATVNRTESYSKSEASHNVDVNVPNMDVIVQRQLVSSLTEVMAG